MSSARLDPATPAGLPECQAGEDCPAASSLGGGAFSLGGGYGG